MWSNQNFPFWNSRDRSFQNDRRRKVIGWLRLWDLHRLVELKSSLADYYIFSDDVTTESVQYYTVKSKFTVSTLTCLDHLAVREDCECDVKQCVIKVNLYKWNTLETPPYTMNHRLWLAILPWNSFFRSKSTKIMNFRKLKECFVKYFLAVQLRPFRRSKGHLGSF